MAYNRLVSLELDDEDKLDAVLPIPMATPDYPPGLRICLTAPEIEKLGLDHTDCQVGDLVDMRCFGTITSITANQNSCRVEIQIQSMSFENEMTEDETDEDD